MESCDCNRRDRREHGDPGHKPKASRSTCSNAHNEALVCDSPRRTVVHPRVQGDHACSVDMSGLYAADRKAGRQTRRGLKRTYGQPNPISPGGPLYDQEKVSQSAPMEAGTGPTRSVRKG